MSDPVNHPKHYNNSPAHCECGRRIECIDITRHMGFALGNCVKYLWRFQDKNGLEDLKKARWYLDDAIKQIETKNPAPQKLPSCIHGLLDNCGVCDGHGTQDEICNKWNEVSDE